VVVSATMTPEVAATLEALRADGHRLVLVTTAAVVPPPVRGLLTHRLPEALFVSEAERQEGGASLAAPVTRPPEQFVAVAGGGDE
jgi:hypothetical protein